MGDQYHQSFDQWVARNAATASDSVKDLLHRAWIAGKQNSRSTALAAADARIEAAEQQVTEALGFAWAEACIQLDAGKDPRKFEVPKLLEKWDVAKSRNAQGSGEQ